MRRKRNPKDTKYIYFLVHLTPRAAPAFSASLALLALETDLGGLSRGRASWYARMAQGTPAPGRAGVLCSWGAWHTTLFAHRRIGIRRRIGNPSRSDRPRLEGRRLSSSRRFSVRVQILVFVVVVMTTGSNDMFAIATRYTKTRQYLTTT
jgi:hypothetical protein